MWLNRVALRVMRGLNEGGRTYVASGNMITGEPSGACDNKDWHVNWLYEMRKGMKGIVIEDGIGSGIKTQEMIGQ